MDDFFLRAVLGGVGVAIMTGPLGCMVVWRRLSYFGAALSHAALLGVALGFLLEIDPTIGVLIVCLSTALVLSKLETHSLLSSDALLGIMAHVLLAAGLVILGLMQGLRIDLMGYLFGDILAVSHRDVAIIFALAFGSLSLLFSMWRSLVTLTISPELAAVEGINVERCRLWFVLLLATVIAVGMKVVGILLVVSLLIIPAAAARLVATTPEQMALMAAALGVISVVSGLSVSLHWDVPSGPAIVLLAALCFLLALLGRRVLHPTRPTLPS